MKIKKILNNNAIISENDQTEEIIIIGKGIAFGKKIDRDKIEKTFILKHNETSEKFKILLEDIPVDYVSISYDIIEYAKNILNVQFNDFIYVTLTDHLNFAIQRYRENIKLCECSSVGNKEILSKRIWNRIKSSGIYK